LTKIVEISTAISLRSGNISESAGIKHLAASRRGMKRTLLYRSKRRLINVRLATGD
jgi:hypothetical protein